MGAATFAAAVIRLALAVGVAGVAGRWIATGLGYGADALGRLATAVVALAVLLVSAEALGLVGALRSGPLEWTQSDPAARVILPLGSSAAVFALSGPLDPRGCPPG